MYIHRPTLDLENFSMTRRNMLWSVSSTIVCLIWPLAVEINWQYLWRSMASLSHWASTSVCSTMCVRQRVALRQLILVWIPTAHEHDFSTSIFYPRDAILARVLASYGPVSVSVCLSQVGVLSKRLNESGWFLARELPLTYPTLCCKVNHVSTKILVLPPGTFPKIST